MGKSRGLYEIRFRSSKPGKNGGQGAEKSFLATLQRGSCQEAQKKCHGGTVIGVRKADKR